MRPRLVTLIAVSAFLAPGALAFAEPGALRQLDGADGCISSDGTGGACATGSGLAGALALAIAPDDASVYVASFSANAVAVLARNASRTAGTIGALSQPTAPDGCIANAPGATCVQGRALGNPFAVAVSRDGRSVYVAGSQSDSVAAFVRAPETGLLRQSDGSEGCVSQDGSNGACADGSGLDRPVGLAVSRDGRSVYATGNTGASLALLARAKRGAAAGALTATGCLSEADPECARRTPLAGPVGVAVSRDGRHVYVASQGASAVLAFARDLRTGALAPLPGLDACTSRDGSGGICRAGAGLQGARSLALSRDGRSLYVVSEFGNAIATFARDRRTGVLRQLDGIDGCTSDGGSPGTCASATALKAPRGVAVSRDGRHVYVAASGSDAVAVFARDRATGRLTQLPGTAGCVSETGSNGACRDGRALRSAGAVVVSEDGRSVYVASFGSGAVAVFARERS